MRMTILRMTILLATVFALAAAPAQAQDVPVVHVSYQMNTFTYDGTAAHVIRGDHFFADDGRHRHDRVFEGEHLSEIWLPERNERIALNATVGLGARGPAMMRFGIPGVIRALPGQQSVPQRPPQAAVAASSGPEHLSATVPLVESLGTRAHGPLVLHGNRVTMPATDRAPERVYESWRYAPDDRWGTQEVEIESTLTAMTASGPVVLMSKQANNVGRAMLAAGRFEAPPVGPATGWQRVVNLWDEVVERVRER